MPEVPDDNESNELQAWIRVQLDTAVRNLIASGAFESALIEVKPAWVLPFRVLIGKAREQGEARAFKWFIGGEVPSDQLVSAAAATPRDALRHFALKWQLDASRRQNPPQTGAPGAPGAAGDSSQSDAGTRLAEHAEALYSLVDDERLWGRENES